MYKGLHIRTIDYTRWLILLLVMFIVLEHQGKAQHMSRLADHPRLIFTRKIEGKLRQLNSKDELLRYITKEIFLLADASLDDALIDYKALKERPHRTTPEALSGKYVLDIASLTGSRLLLLGTAYRLNDDPDKKNAYFQRILKELEATLALPDWNAGHFLDIAEISLGVAIIYDWLNDDLSSELKKRMESALLENSLKPGIEAYEQEAKWTKRFNNWTQVVNGGLILSALAIGDKYPGVCHRLLEYARAVMPKAMQHIYAPEGVYVEGPSYWQYGTTFNVMLIDAMQTALGNDWDLLNTTGFEETGAFQMHCISPTYRYFNYADAPEEARLAPALFRLSAYYNEPAYADYMRGWLKAILKARPAGTDEPAFSLSGTLSGEKTARFLPLAAIWYVEDDGAFRSIGKNALFKETGLAVMRSEWYRKDAIYAGIKGGENGVSHSHLDLGSFILDAEGIRWAIDLGREVYNLPGMFDYSASGARWDYFRLGTHGHNTLMINGKNQTVNAKASLLRSHFSATRSHVIMDVSEAYIGQADTVKRGVALIKGKQVLIQDEINGIAPGDTVRWGMITRADIELNNNEAVLRQEGKELHARILEPVGAHFQIISTQPNDQRQKQNPGTCMLAVNSVAKSEAMSIVIAFTPGNDNHENDVSIKALNAW